jgi:hypothetical protein
MSTIDIGAGGLQVNVTPPKSVGVPLVGTLTIANSAINIYSLPDRANGAVRV